MRFPRWIVGGAARPSRAAENPEADPPLHVSLHPMSDAPDELSPKTLLRRTRWLDGIARELVDDPHAAQDAVQDAWLLALRHQGRVARLGPWLAQVVRRLAGRARRREGERTAREARAARPEAEPSSLDLLLRVQQQQRVVAAVLRLEEPYRTTVLMRFFEDLPPRSIAARMGVPVATVRTRLQRALERLRVMLDEQAGSRAAWIAPLASGLAVPHAAASTLLALVMNTKLVTGVALAAIALLSVGLWMKDSGTPARSPSAPVPVETSGMARMEEQVPSEAETPSTAVASRSSVVNAGTAVVPSPTDLVALRGHVVDGDSHPIAGAKVEVLEELGAGFSLLAEARETEMRGVTTTGGDGAFAVDVPFARALMLRTSARAFATRSVEPCYGGQDHTIVLQPGASFEGRITDASTGAPVADVVLHGWFRDGSADRIDLRSAPDGTFRAENLPSGTLLCDVTPPEHEAQLRKEIELQGGETARIDLVLQRGDVVFGTVTDATTKEPIAGAEISAGWTFDKVVHTDIEGKYRMVGAPGPGVPDMHVRAKGFAHASAQIGKAHEQRVDFALERGGSLRGRVVDAAGRPVAGVYVAADADLGVSRGMGLTDWQNTRSGADGMFRVESLVPGGEYALLLRQRGRATLAYLVPKAIEADHEIDVGDLRMLSPAVLLGRVVDQKGQGIAGVRVSLNGANADHTRMLEGAERESRRLPLHASSRDAQTDAEGRFRFGDLAGGAYALRASMRGGVSATRDEVQIVATATTSEPDLVLDLGMVIAGKVVTEDGTPAPNAHAVIQIDGSGAESGGRRMTLAQPDGSFRVLGLAEGRYRVTASLSNWANDEPSPWIGTTVDDVDAGREDLRVVLRRAAWISGRVVDAEGRGLAGIAVLAVEAGGKDIESRTKSAQDGSFRLRVPPDSLWDLRYGEAFELRDVPLLEVRAETARTFKAVRAGTAEVSLEWR